MFLGLLEQIFHEILKYSMFGLGALVFLILLFVKAGYGRYVSKKWGPQINPKLGWVLMEMISPLLVAIFFFTSAQVSYITSIVFLLIWELHYIQRSFVYPFLIRSKKQMPISIILMGFIFNGINAYLQGRFLFVIRDPLDVDWLFSPQFIIGTIIFLIGFIINLQSDYILRHLRTFDEIRQGTNGYKIPYGGLFKYISCPNYLGEILEWIGWAILTWSISGLVFAFWTIANLAPRARSHHKWYQSHFEDYPEDRKVLIPFIF